MSRMETILLLTGKNYLINKRKQILRISTIENIKYNKLILGFSNTNESLTPKLHIQVFSNLLKDSDSTVYSYIQIETDQKITCQIQEQMDFILNKKQVYNRKL